MASPNIFSLRIVIQSADRGMRLASEQHGTQPLQANGQARPNSSVCCSSKRRSSAPDPSRPQGLVSRFRTPLNAKLCRIHSTAQETSLSPVAERDMPSPLEFIRSLGTDKVAHSGEAALKLDAKLSLAGLRWTDWRFPRPSRHACQRQVCFG